MVRGAWCVVRVPPLAHACVMREVSIAPACSHASLATRPQVGALCGLVLGAFVLVVGVCCRIVTFHVGVVVCISLPLVSLWANFLGSTLPLLAVRLKRNPAVTSAPLMTTIIDSTGRPIDF